MTVIRHRLNLVVILTVLAAVTAILLVSFLAAPALGSFTGAGSIIYVDKTVPESGNGHSWKKAFQNLQDALDAASSGDEIWVARGTYYPDEGQDMQGGDRKATFQLRNGVAIYGGFLGGETSLDERDPWNFVTTLSGDIDGNDTTAFHDLVLSPAGISGKNSFHVVTGSGTDSSAVLDGFAITAGHANGSAAKNKHEGGGLFVKTGGPLLENLIFSGNLAEEGGAAAQVGGSVSSFEHVIFAGNGATDFGGALHNEDSDPTLTNVLMSGNGAAAGGGAIYNVNSSPELNNVTISGNAAGASVVLAGLQPTAVDVPAMGGGLFNLTASKPQIRNSIIWNNEDDSGSSTASASIHNQDGGSTPTADHSDIQALAAVTGLIYDGTSIDADPEFVAPLDPAAAPIYGGDYRLKALSPAIDAGDDSFNTLPTDLAGHARIQGAAIDMGAYETTPAPDIAVHKTSDIPAASLGEIINYSYELINTGGVTVTAITAVDDLLGPIDFGITELAPGYTATSTLSYTVLFSDIPGPVANTAEITGTVGVSTTVVTSDTVQVSLSYGPSLGFLPVVAYDYPPETPTPTPSPTPSPTPTNTPSPITCENIAGNSGFEDNSDWLLEITAYSAKYTSSKQHSGARSVRTGIVSQSDNIFSYSSAMQTVTIPADATEANLSFYIYPQTTETSPLKVPAEVLQIRETNALSASDLQLVLILDQNNNEIARLYADRRNDQTWLAGNHDLLGFKGQTIKLYFGTLNNGIYNQGVTAMYVDDVELEVCAPN